MTDILGRVRDSFRPDQRADPERLVERLHAVNRFLGAVDGHLPDDRLVAGRTLIERAGTRLALSLDHTVVALAGATGSGKSSLFNSLARFEMSPVGVRRPTTGVTHACVWGPLDGAARLLDWVGVLPRHRFVRESALDGADEAALHGLVLLDLPDFDSVEWSHRSEVDRLLGLVDLVVWVVDPQKYADKVLHRSYLREFHRHRDITVVALNQADRLAPQELPRVLADLRRLVDADGLDGVPVLATSALSDDGTSPLRAALEQAVAQRQSALRRLSGDVDSVVDGLAELVDARFDARRVDDDVDRPTIRRLIDALAGAAGVPAVAEATEQAYRHRAVAATGWPLARGLRRLRPDPLRRLHLAGTPAEPERPAPPGGLLGLELRPVPVTSVPEPTAAQRSAVGLAVRAVADRAGATLPGPWPAAVSAAARSRQADLPDALDRAVAGTELGMARRPVWWRLVNAVQWLVTTAAAVGLGWLLLGYAVRALGLPELDHPTVGVAPLPTVLLLGGLLGGALLSLLVKPVIRWAARRARWRAEGRMHDAVAEVARGYVVSPVREVLRAYAEARAALVVAAGRR
ncbi:50S ribosome-binding GTPase [Micromonospora sp. WMMD1102]|uniref:GTPase n=1 Tax=Micromonospora sp. WMMD1102 TaxID=3016105 RepID=UPI00241594D7|nr:GTPase [Micromonospora sp. WMMD1102]MDG4790790.1 50S ribosome-binding GTPase [Micromonospora sp. WMMD1102]